MADAERTVKERSTGETLRLVGGVALAVVLIIFALLNLNEVEVNWIFGTWSTPLIVVLVLGLILGALIDRLVIGRLRGRHSRSAE